MNTESNKIIAEFMNFKIKNLQDKLLVLKMSDWNWLMEVIIKISKIPTEDGEDTFYPRTFGMLNDEGEFMFRFNRHQLFKANTLIKAAYEACVDFIEWYNQQNSKDGKISQNTIK